MGIQARIVHRLPDWIRRSPLDVMFSFMGLVSSMLSLIGIGKPGSLSQVLPWWGPLLWSLCLLVGSAAWMAGVASIKESEGVLILVRMPVFIFGLYLVSLAAFAYGLVLIVFAGWSGVVASVLFFAVAGGTYLRRIDVASKFRGDTS